MSDTKQDRELWQQERLKHLKNLGNITQGEINDLESAIQHHLTLVKKLRHKQAKARKRLEQHSGRS